MKNKKFKKGTKLWKEATKIIPGGNMLISKDLNNFYLTIGQHIFLKVKNVMYGI